VLINDQAVAPTSPVVFGVDEFETDARIALVQSDTGLTRTLVHDATSLWEGGTQLFSSATKVRDLDVHYDGTDVAIDASPSAATVTIYAPSTTSLTLNGRTQPFSQIGDDIQVALWHQADRLTIEPAGEYRAWVGSIFSVEVDAVDANGFVDGTFSGTVSLSVSPSSVELSADDFETKLAAPLTLDLIEGRASLYVRVPDDNAGLPITIGASCTGACGALTAATKDDIYIDSLATTGWQGPSTTLPPSTTTSTSTTTTTLPFSLLIEGFESGDFETNGWLNGGAQIWSFGQGNIHSGQYSARMNNDDMLTKQLDLCGYSNVTVQYWRYTKQRESNDHLIVQWWDGTSWHVLEDLAGNDDWAQKTFALPSGADDNPEFALQFINEHGGTQDLAFIDDIEISALPSGRY
jgi:hypothetical protein